MNRKRLFPDYIFESSWEVCHKVGGIYTVLSTRAMTLQAVMGDNLLFIGPDLGDANTNFIEDRRLLKAWHIHAQMADGLRIRVGRWNIPGQPVAILTDFTPYYAQKNDIYARAWETSQVDSLHAYGDYDEASMFSYAAAKVVESFYRFHELETKRVVYHANEWMTGLGLLYLRHMLPRIATVFTTHATSIGRSIAGNGKPLYAYLSAYNGDQMATELNMQSKHSVEKQTAKYADCFTTVSDITAEECRELLDKPVDAVLSNGFENGFVPKGTMFTKRRKIARRRMLDVANALLGTSLDDNTLIVSTSGRYEFRNKGIDVYIDALNRLRFAGGMERDVLAFIEVPAWAGEARQDLQERLKRKETAQKPLADPLFTHWLHDAQGDRVVSMMHALGMENRAEDRVKLIFVPHYLNGADGIFDLPYYDLLIGNDLCVYPSYYEPWGYTPLESIAFKIPCITTTLAGFGLWANRVMGRDCRIDDGVEVIARTDDDYNEVVEAVKDTILRYAHMPEEDVKAARKAAGKLSEKALWKKFIHDYYKAYDIALRHAESRVSR
ncbi:glycogen/starch synthase [Hoylesella marshii]|uniref:Starch synthase n=1 Tax=Hoylesella marshii DSM 16973 = JCM 13450 TaxID=862515 RepID=E0NV64_9BACT|nr:glycogen/starch synthase [Hoylesella marshii]EFM00975.1 starch synthase [Hoylesella marshii DSM 16973 = JCM 13450]